MPDASCDTGQCVVPASDHQPTAEEMALYSGQVTETPKQERSVVMPGDVAPPIPQRTGPKMVPVTLKDFLTPSRLATLGASLRAADVKQAVTDAFNEISQPGLRVNRDGKSDEDGWLNEDLVTKKYDSIEDLDVREAFRKRVHEDNQQRADKYKALALKIKAYGEKVGGNRGFIMPDQRDQGIAADIEALRANDPESLDKLYKESNQKERERTSQIRTEERWASQRKLQGFYANVDLEQLKKMSPEDVQHMILGSGLLGSEQRAVLGFYHSLQRDAKPLETAAALVRQRAQAASPGNKRMADTRYANAMQILMDEGWSAKYDPQALSTRLDKMFQDPGTLARLSHLFGGSGGVMEVDEPRVRAPGAPAAPSKTAPGKDVFITGPDGQRMKLDRTNNKWVPVTP